MPWVVFREMGAQSPNAAPEHLRGRAYAAYNGLRNGAEIVALSCSGVLIATVGARWTLLLAGGLPMLVALAARYGRLREPAPAWAR